MSIEERKKGLHPWRRLADNAALTADDWRLVYFAQQAFIYQIRRIVSAAEARNDNHV